MNRTQLLLLGVLLCLLSSCRSTGPDGATISRPEVLAHARKYTALTWQGKRRHAMHGTAPDGQRIDTPDVLFPKEKQKGFWWKEGQNVGMPYKWGGFDTPEQFTRRLEEEPVVYAGDYASANKVAGGDESVSRYAAGIDCSGLVSRCWGLPRPYSTRELPDICTPLSSLDKLKPGDIILRPGEHVQLFVRWEDDEHTKYRAIEAAGDPEWRCFEIIYNRHTLTTTRGFTPWRYKGIR
ncbi:MAG: hypothetical protein IJB33_03160 [Akkermansia sp.]|nr:hypothetical protein [Akkermansia sp.]MBQ4594812.1 hypothetical protein [Akkermansia sp.]